MWSRPRWLMLCIVSCFVFVDILAAQTIHVSVRGKAVEGKPLFWNDSAVALMSRDGQLITFATGDAEAFRQVSPRFSSHSQSTLRGELLREYGNGFDVSGTGQFLVVHPVGQRDQWADRFEQLYRSMMHYLAARGFTVTRPEFPLVAVVFPSQQQYLDDARSRGENVSANMLGYYDTITNRIYMYDITALTGKTAHWYINAETIIHEAAHQTAFNVGIHDRLGENPRWVVEGLGTLFEAPGVWDSQTYRQREDRVNRNQLDEFRRLAASTDSVALLQRQIASDQLFMRAPSAAYAQAWALTFFLTEREPRRYAQYLQQIRRRPPFQAYAAEDRLRDFVAAFGQDFRMLDARLQRFVSEL